MRANASNGNSCHRTIKQFAKAIGVDQLFGETGYTTDERRWARPTFDINGLTSGHQGEGRQDDHSGNRVGQDQFPIGSRSRSETVDGCIASNTCESTPAMAFAGH